MALREHERADAGTIRQYCAEHGVDAAEVKGALQRMRRNGEVTEVDGQYRLL